MIKKRPNAQGRFTHSPASRGEKASAAGEERHREGV